MRFEKRLHYIWCGVFLNCRTVYAHTTNHSLSPLKQPIAFLAVSFQFQVLDHEVLMPGCFDVQWNASGFSSGMYFYRLTALQKDGGHAGNFVETKKLLLMK